MRVFFGLFFTLFLHLESFACTATRDRINKLFDSRTQAFQQAKRDANISRTAQPLKVDHVDMVENGKRVMVNGQVVKTREYHYRTNDGKVVVIQEHTAGHQGSLAPAGGMPHLNVRPIENTRTGRVAGTAAHYNIGVD
jgi:toxin YqcG